MTSADGHGAKKWAILYARVSTEEQVRTGYSLAQQMEALRTYVTREGYEVLEEVTDPGQSGATLERTGMDRVRDLVSAGGASVVLAQDRDRIAREPAYHYLLKREFEEHGTKIRALNDRGDESPEGELTDGILDQLAKFERAKTAERTRRGKLRKAREGKIVASTAPNFGYEYNDSRDNYVVNLEKMRIMERIFHMVGVEQRSLRWIKRALEAEGVTTPSGNKRWHARALRELLLSDVYRPHTYEEIEKLVSPAVAARLNSSYRYGVWWFNRQRITRRKVAELSSSGRVYREKVKATIRPREEWIAVPVPDSGIPREVVDAAREVILNNKPPSSNGDRFWELSGGLFHCGICGSCMRTSVTRKATKHYFYYLCWRHREERDACPNRKAYRAHKVESDVWGLVSELLKDPQRVRDDLERMIEWERYELRGDPEREAKTWLEKLSEVDQERRGFLRLAAKGRMTDEDLDTELADLEETRRVAERELETLRSYRERIERLERDKDTLLESYVAMVPEALDSLTPEERHHIYKMLRLDVSVNADGEIEVAGNLVANPEVCNTGSPSPYTCSPTTPAASGATPTTPGQASSPPSAAATSTGPAETSTSQVPSLR